MTAAGIIGMPILDEAAVHPVDNGGPAGEQPGRGISKIFAHAVVVEPWESLDKKLCTFRGLVEQQQHFLADMHQHVRAQASLQRQRTVFRRQVSPHPERGSQFLGNSFLSPSQSCLMGSAASSRRGSASFATASTVLSARRQDEEVLPVLTVYHHGAGNVLTAAAPVTVPPIRQGFRPWVMAELERVVDSPAFEPAMGVIIALNAINIGVTIDRELQGLDTTVSNTFESVFLVVFTMELILRAVVRGWRILATGTSAVDTFLILLTLLTTLVKPLLQQSAGGIGTALDQLLILRMARLLRLARSARLVACLESLWKLAHGLMRCVGVMASACFLMFATLYIFACFGAELIAKPLVEDPVVGEIMEQSFSTMPKILLTLCQFVSMDSTAAFYRPLVEHTPLLALYFALIVIIVPIALLNLTTAILVEDVISTVQADEELNMIHRRRQFKQLTPALTQLFKAFDTSKDGRIQIREVANAIRDGLKIPEALQAFLDPARMLDLFDALDADNSGDVSENEFIDGLTYASMSGVSIESIQMLHLLRSLKQEVGRLSKSWHDFHDGVGLDRWQLFEDGQAVCSVDSEGALAI